MKNWNDMFNEELNANPEYKELKEGSSKTNRYIITKAGTIIKYTGEIETDVNGKEHLKQHILTPENDHNRVRIGGLRYSANYLHRLYFPELYVKTKTTKPAEVIDEPGELWKYVDGTADVYVSNHKRIKALKKNGGSKLIKSVRDTAHNKLSLFTVFKQYWNIDLLYEGDLDGEIWAGVFDADDVEVSNLGRVRTTNYKDTGTIKLLNTWKANGYVYVSYIDNSGVMRKRTVHKLVGLAFVVNDDPKHKIEIDHKNTIRDDNRAENLSWTTKRENFDNPLSHLNRSNGQKRRWNGGKI